MAARRREQSFYRPVFTGAESLDLHLALDDQAQGDRLHTSGGFRAGQFAPKHGREVEPHQIVQRAAGEIGLDQRHVDLTRVLHRLGHGLFGDLVKDDAANGRVFLDRLALGQRLLQVPADRLAFAVGVSREDQCVVFGQRVGDGFDVFLAVGGDFPFHVEIGVGVDRSVLWRQVPDVAVRGENGVIVAQIFVDRFGLGWGFDNDDGHKYRHLRSKMRAALRCLMWDGGGVCQCGCCG